jgi:WD40 repeat protein
MLLPGKKDRVSSLAFSPDGKTLAAGYSSGVVRLWDTATGGELLALEGPRINPLVRFAGDGSALAIMRGAPVGQPMIWLIRGERPAQLDFE